MNDRVVVNLYLDQESREGLERQAEEAGLSLSAFLRALGRFMREPVSLKTEIPFLRQRWNEILREETHDRSMRRIP